MTRENNKGFSYVEMLMVLAIMAIMIGMVTISVGLVSRNTVSRTSEKLESLVNKARTTAMTKGSTNGYLFLAEVNGSVYAYVGNKETIYDSGNPLPANVKKFGEKICNNGYEIRLGSSTSTSDKAVHFVGFKQSTGGMSCLIDGTALGGTTSLGFLVQKKNTPTKQSVFNVYVDTGKVWR